MDDYIPEILRDKSAVNFAQSITQLEFLGLIKCSKISKVLPTSYLLLDLSSRPECQNSNSEWLLNGASHSVDIQLTNGEKWNVSYLISNTSWFYIFLWISRVSLFLFIILAWYLIKRFLDIKINLEREKVTSMKKVYEVSSQVAHDIRSPLSALNMVMATIVSLSEDERVIIRSAIQRINDIANDLLQKGKNENSFVKDRSAFQKNELTKELIPALVEVLVSEKRMQYRECSDLSIDIETKDCFGAFGLVNSVDFKRVLSNLVNNAVESFENQSGKVLVKVQKINNQVNVSVIDNGKGIPHHILEKLGKEKISYGKELSFNSGNGLGLYHAKQLVELQGGKFEIFSTVGTGTSVSILINLVDSPSWFANTIDLTNKTIFVSLDDDISIHQIWGSRFNALGIDNIVLKQFQSGKAFVNFITENLSDIVKMRFLVDYELVNQFKSGLDIIEEFDLAKNSILVTSRYEEGSIQRRSASIGLKILPKSLAGFVPFKIDSEKIKYDIVLLDDDQLIRLTWEMKARKNNKSILCFASTIELWANLDKLDKNSIFYIDVHISEIENGEDISKELFKLGFLNLYLATGFEADQFAHVTWVKGVVGKNPIC
jgi:signal transduction histidine kinase